MQAGKEITGTGLKLAQEDDLKVLAKALSQNERVVLENRQLHRFLFRHIRWTKKASDRERDGMFIKTLEMKPPQLAVFKLCSSWKIMEVFSLLGLPGFIAKENEKIYAQSGAFMAILAPGIRPQDFVAAGRRLQRVWLTAAKLGLSAQPLAGIVLLYQKIQQQNSPELSPAHVTRIKAAYRQAASIFKSGSQTITFILRIGRAQAPSAVSPRYILEKIIT